MSQVLPLVHSLPSATQSHLEREKSLNPQRQYLICCTCRFYQSPKDHSIPSRILTEYDHARTHDIHFSAHHICRTSLDISGVMCQALRQLMQSCLTLERNCQIILRHTCSGLLCKREVGFRWYKSKGRMQGEPGV